MASVKEHFMDGKTWLRGLYMLLFVIAYNIAAMILVVLTIFQFLCALLTGGVNRRLLQLGKNLSRFINQVWDFLTFNTEIKPYPFSSWPDQAPGGEAWREGPDAGETTGGSASGENHEEEALGESRDNT